ncbi:hypothetical protein BGZ76_000253 [Entomortierella beljakovae]|nr:hypothetical protein BGZ76_000253 [Entomortierella beljakovae]
MQPYVSYNNVMYAVGGIAAANAADMQYEDLVREKIFKPLGLKSAGFTTEEMTKFKNYASPYNAATYEDAIEGRFNRLPLTNVADAIAPSGNIHSNVLDLVRWGQTIMKNGELDGKQVMNKDNVIETLTGQSILTKSQSGFPPEFPPTSAYGLGWVLESYKGNNNYWHNGAIDGYRSNLIMFPDSELVVGILTNAGDSTLQMGIPYYIADEILGLPKTRDWIGNAINDTKTNYELAAEAIKNAYPPQIKNAPASHKLSDFAGVYTDPLYGDLSITLGKNSKGKEELTLKLRVYESKLSHYHYDSFKTVIKYSATIFPELVSFVTDQDGKHVDLHMQQREKVQRGSSEETVLDHISTVNIFKEFLSGLAPSGFKYLQLVIVTQANMLSVIDESTDQQVLMLLLRSPL